MKWIWSTPNISGANKLVLETNSDVILFTILCLSIAIAAILIVYFGIYKKR